MKKLSQSSPKKTHNKRRILAGCAALIVIACATLATYHVLHLRKQAPLISKATTTSKQPTAQSNFTSDDSRVPAATNDASDDSNTIADTKGSIASMPPSSQWSKSADGSSIVVYTPAANGTLSSGDTLSGAATSTSVSFRLVDNVTGVIAQGRLAVVNGKFSGTFDFTTKAAQGQVDIFNQAADGTESNNVTIPVRFGS